MRFPLNYNEEHIFILGAGASVEYGLPTWSKLSGLIKNKVESDKNDQFKYKKEILNWLNKIGDSKQYKTIDECIALESVAQEYHHNGHQIEEEIFHAMKDIFEEVYRENGNGWIRLLNEKIKNNQNLKLEDRIVFVNYNYDNVLDKNFLNFDYLPEKYKLFNYSERLSHLSYTLANSFHPHGYFPSDFLPKNTARTTKTMKSENSMYIDAVSCYESEKHTVVRSVNYDDKKRSLYILGLGAGLEINLNNISFEVEISNIHVTVKNQDYKDKIVDFLSKKFKIPVTEIKVYTSCYDLVNNCF